MAVLGDEVDRRAASAAGRDATQSAIVSIELPADTRDPARRIAERLGELPCAQVLVFAAPVVDLTALMGELSARFPRTPIAGCTTAGEIGGDGYAEDRIIAVALPARHFACKTVVVRDLSTADLGAAATGLLAARLALGDANRDKPESFALLLVDGLSLREDMLAGALAPALGGTPIFGGSAGDGRRFSRTLVAFGREVLSDAALVVLARTDHIVKVFSLDNLRPTEQRMVVTAADPERRIVKEINAEPAAREYARIVGKDPEQLDAFTFAAHPVTVRLGGSHHVRAIQRVTDAGELVFFSAVEEGMVLAVAEADDMVDHLENALARLTMGGAAKGILACDCILRRIAAEQAQQAGRLSRVLARHGVTGFSTYGEQIGPLHLNQTMTGVAFFAADRQGRLD